MTVTNLGGYQKPLYMAGQAAKTGQIAQAGKSQNQNMQPNQPLYAQTSGSNSWNDTLMEALKETHTEGKVPYSALAKDGIIEYEGVVFVCDEKNNRLCLGDVSDPKQCLTIPLSKGGTLVVNRDNLGDLSHAIGMFSPEDVNRILGAMAQDAKVQEMEKEIEDAKNSIGKSADENTGGNNDGNEKKTPEEE